MSKNKIILVIEDEQELCNLLNYDLSSRNYDVKIAKNGQEGLNMLQHIQPDLIICDRAMPIMSGFQLLERIRGAYPQYNSVPFIFLTAMNDPRDIHSVDHLNPTAYLEKPVDFEKLAQTIEQALSRK